MMFVYLKLLIGTSSLHVRRSIVGFWEAVIKTAKQNFYRLTVREPR